MTALLMSMGPMFSTAARGASLLDGPHWSRCYSCADGGFISVQCLEPKFYALFLQIMGLEADAGFADQFDQAQWPGQTEALAAIFATKPRDHWAALFEGSDACVAPVLSLREAQADPHIAARGVWQNGQPAAAPRFDGAEPSVPQPCPERGQDSAAIRAELEEKGLI